MTNYKYLVIGGGMTAAAAIEGIRKVDQSAAIGLVSSEPDSPYNRPPLSKGLWKGDKRESIWRPINDQSVTLHLGRTAKHLDPQSKQIVDDQDTIYNYAKLLLATGASPNHLPFGGDEIMYFRTLRDYDRLRTLAEKGKRFVVIGGGFIGSEIAAALAMVGKDVAMAFPDKGIGSRMFPPELSQFLNDYYREKTVEVLTGYSITGLEAGDQIVHLSNAASGSEQDVMADGVVAGIGVKPNVELAQAAGIVVDAGILVNSSLLTNMPDIYAAGDVASFHNPALDKWMRVEHEDNANTMGECAGAAMGGSVVSYDHLPFFYSDLFELGYEAVGEVDSRLEMVQDWKDPYKEGVVYYLREGRVRGVLLWNVWEQVDAARRLIASTGPFSPADLKGRLPE